MPRHGRDFALLVGLVCCLAGFHSARAAHAAVGTAVANAEMPALDGGKARPLADVDANVLLFFRPNQERSLGALTELAQCLGAFAGKSVRLVGVVSDSAPAASAVALVREARFAAPVLVDGGDALYGSLGVALHPVVVIVGRDHKLAAFEPFRSLDYCTVVAARIRHALREISDDELRLALDPPKATEGGDEQVARRYRALAEAQFKAGNHEKALDSVRKSIDKSPGLAPAQTLMGEVLAAQGNCTEAVKAFARALAIDSGSAAAKAGIERCKAAR